MPGAHGIVVPHVTDAATAERVARASRFGPGGRGYAGSTRWAGFATRAMPEMLAAASETLVIAQIEDPEAVEAVEEIAATPGIDALFLGPADLSVGYGHDTQDNADLARAYARTGEAARAAGRAFMTFVPNAAARGSDACRLWRQRLLHRLRTCLDAAGRAARGGRHPRVGLTSPAGVPQKHLIFINLLPSARATPRCGSSLRTGSTRSAAPNRAGEQR
jgi:hypothetical protein